MPFVGKSTLPARGYSSSRHDMGDESAITRIVEAGDGTVTGMFIPEYENTWEMTVRKPGGEIIKRGIWQDTVKRMQQAGGSFICRKQKIVYADRTDYQMDIVQRADLLPVRIRINSAGEPPHTDIQYTPGKVFGRKILRVADGDEIRQMPVSFSFELPQPVFDWHLWGILVAGFPLENGYAGRFLAHESYSYLPGDFRWISLTVTGTETIAAGRWGNIECWLVEVCAEVRWKIWIARDRAVAPVQQICIDYFDGSELWWRPS